MKHCGKYEDLLARFLHGEVLLHEKEELESHIAVCAACERLYRDITDLDRALREASEKVVEPPPYLHARILANLPEQRRSSVFAGSRGRWAAALCGAAAIALAAFAVVKTASPPKGRVASAHAPAAVPDAVVPPRNALPASPAGPEPQGPAKAGPSVAVSPRVQIIREVKIYFYYPPALKVAVMGDFNGWDSEGVPLKPAGKPGLWTANLRLPPGAYSYNFIVDGEVLVPDPNAANQTPDGYGGTNSILLVKEGDSA